MCFGARWGRELGVTNVVAGSRRIFVVTVPSAVCTTSGVWVPLFIHRGPEVAERGMAADSGWGVVSVVWMVSDFCFGG